MADPRAHRILVVDDEPDVTALLAYHLKSKGYDVEVINGPHRAIGAARAFQPDLVVLDVMMPGLSGIQICRLLRADIELEHVPIVFLTAKGEESDRIQGFETGADDYICKPFNTKELLLRIQSILRRAAEGRRAPAETFTASGISLDVERHEVRVQGAPVELTATEFKLLRLLIERRGRVQTREQLLVHVWNYGAEIETRTVDTHMRRLREKLGSAGACIETIRGVGYRLTERPAPAPAH